MIQYRSRIKQSFSTLAMASDLSIKLQKFLAQAGIASRRAAEALIAARKVQVNGQTATIGQRIDPTNDRVSVQGKRISAQPPEAVYFLINKPVGLVSSAEDELGRETVLSLLPASIRERYRLYPVGRLDKDSEGLMLLTNDGELTNRLTHPRYQVEKTYLALIDREPSDLALRHLERGVQLQEGRTSPAQVELLYEWREDLGIDERDFYRVIERVSAQRERDADRTGEPLSADRLPIWLMITIHEGRYHQVRRMLERVGYDTLRLVRIAMGEFELEQLRGRRVMQIEVK